MDVVFEGALSRSWGMADVLRGIMGVENQQYGILRISSPGSNVSGRLAIRDSKFIVGAAVSDGSEQGYAAVRRLLMSNDGNFAYLDTAGKKTPDFEQGLYIAINKMVDIWPNLPDDPNELFDQEALLDKVFGGEGVEDSLDPSSGQLPAIQPKQEPQKVSRKSLIKAMQEATNAAAGAAGPANAAQKQQQWKTVAPLLSNSLVDGAKTLQGSYIDIDDTAGHERQSLTKLRAVSPEEEPWLQKMLKEAFASRVVFIGFILIVLLVATFVVSAALNK